ncbi:TPA: hypothetical protein DD394_08370 [bacterium UBP9_UBA11836]|nr:hypothetical protein [bacterium UBP9_UBA11836]
MSESDKYKQALEDNFGENSGANARFGNPNVQKLLQQMDSEREIHTHSWSEGNLSSSSSRRSAVDSLVGSSNSGKDRFIPSQQDLIKAVGSSRSKSSSSSSSSSSSKSSDSSSGSKSSSSGSKSEVQTLTKETKRFVIGLGLLCFIIGAILITFIYSPLNDRGAERVLDETELAQSGKQTVTSSANGNQALNSEATENQGDEPLIVEVDEETAQSLTADKKALPTVGKVKLDGIKVYVVGAVKNPGIVTLPFDSRVDDAIKAAGGMSDNAEPLSVNLAKRIKDEDKIYVAFKGETDSLSGTGVVEQRADTSGIIAEKAREAAADGGKIKAKDSGKSSSAGNNEKGDAASAEFTVNLNTASEEELQKIPGVGPSISKSIIDYRNKLPDGKFTNKAQLKDVIGIGEASYSKLEPYVKL